MTIKDYAIDCLAYTALKALGPLFRLLPPEECLKVGALLGDVFYVLDRGHRAKVYDNIRTALGDRLRPEEIRKECRGFYRSYGQNLAELFLIPLIDEEYLRRYITVEGMENLRAAFAAGKGVLLTGVHEGNWELSNIICAVLGLPFGKKDHRSIDRLRDLELRYRGCLLAALIANGLSRRGPCIRGGYVHTRSAREEQGCATHDGRKNQ
jgi:lauroyl/myristoyl acyltransferase